MHAREKSPNLLYSQLSSIISVVIVIWKTQLPVCVHSVLTNTNVKKARYLHFIGVELRVKHYILDKTPLVFLTIVPRIFYILVREQMDLALIFHLKDDTSNSTTLAPLSLH